MNEVFDWAGEKWSVKFFKTHTLDECRRILRHKNANQVINVWKQINGKSVRTKKKKEE